MWRWNPESMICRFTLQTDSTSALSLISSFCGIEDVLNCEISCCSVWLERKHADSGWIGENWNKALSSSLALFGINRGILHSKQDPCVLEWMTADKQGHRIGGITYSEVEGHFEAWVGVCLVLLLTTMWVWKADTQIERGKLSWHCFLYQYLNSTWIYFASVNNSTNHSKASMSFHSML